MIRQRLPVVLSAAAVLIAVLGATPNGFASLKGVARVALFAKNAAKVGGIGASKKPKAGKLLPLGRNGKFPASVLPVGLQGPPGREGARGPAGPAGPQGAGGIGPKGNRGSTVLGAARRDRSPGRGRSSGWLRPAEPRAGGPDEVHGQRWWRALVVRAGADGFPLVAVFDGSNNALKVVHCNDSACSTATSTTVNSTVANVGRYPSVTVGSDGLGLVSYLDATNDNLKVAHCTNLACTAYTRATVVSSGRPQTTTPLSPSASTASA